MRGDAARRRRGRWVLLAPLVCSGLVLSVPALAAPGRSRVVRQLGAPSGVEGRATRTVVLRPTSVIAGKWKEGGSGFGEVVEPEVEERDYWAVAPRHKALSAKLGPMPTLGPGEIVTKATVHVLVETGQKPVTMQIQGSGVSLTVPKNSNHTAWHEAEAGVEGESPQALERLSFEVRTGAGATVYSVYVVLTIESERARFIDSHGGSGQASAQGTFEPATNQALMVGQTTYLFLVTRGSHGASNFHDEAGNTWNRIYEETAGPFVCQLWASDISKGSIDKGTRLIWEGLPAGAYVYRALIALGGGPAVSDAVDVGASSSVGPAAERVEVTTPATRSQGDFAMAIVVTTADGTMGGPGQRVSGWSNPAPTESFEANGLSGTFAFETFPAKSSSLSVIGKAGKTGEMGLFVVSLKTPAVL
jgi:hypothetical protein